jgi:RNA polymerase sigma-70 factor (ECF subfamily)
MSAAALTETAFRSYGSAILSFLYRLTGCRHEAESLCQETFFRLLRAAPEFPSEASLRTWLYRVARRLALDAGRKHRPELTETPLVPDPSPGPVETRERREEVDRLLRSLHRLPALYRHTLTLRFLEELDYPDIAEIEGVSQSALRTRVQKGLSLLRAELDAGRTRTATPSVRS